MSSNQIQELKELLQLFLEYIRKHPNIIANTAETSAIKTVINFIDNLKQND